MAWVTRLGLNLTVYHTTSPDHVKQTGSLSIAHAHYTVQATANDLGHSIIIQPGLDHMLMHPTQSRPVRVAWATAYSLD